MPENKENQLILTQTKKEPFIYEAQCDRAECNFRGSQDCHVGMYIGKSFLFHHQNLPSCGRAIADNIKEWTFVEEKNGKFIYKIQFK